VHSPGSVCWRSFNIMLRLIAAATAAAAAAGSNAPRPNIIWIMSDDLGVGEIGLYPSDNPHGQIETPHLDKLGKEGIVFTQAYAGYTVCAPSRTTFFSGRQNGKFVEHGLNGQVIKVEQNVTTLAHVLQSAGYRTGAFGKVAPLDSPLEQGFDAFVGQVDQAKCHNMYPKQIDSGKQLMNFQLVGNHKEKNRKLCMASPELYNYTIDVFHDYGMAWLEQVAKKPEPFFLYLSFTIPHAGGWGDAPNNPENGAPVPTDLQYAHKSWPTVEKDHAAVITYLDDKVGDVMNRLAKLGIDNNTLVFFASDNGAHLEGGHSHKFFNSTGGLSGHKRSLFEGGVRSPTMVRWPAAIRPGRTSDFQWAFWDVMPTFAELAGGKVPAGLDGLSIVPELKGEKQPEHEYLYFTWPGLQRSLVSVLKPKATSGYSVRVGTWKGLVPHCANAKTWQPSMDDQMQLYNIDQDPFEITDVANKHANVVHNLKVLLISKNLTCHCYQCGGIFGADDELDPIVV